MLRIRHSFLLVLIFTLWMSHILAVHSSSCSGQTLEVTLAFEGVCMDAAILKMACSVCGGHTLAWKGDVDEAKFFSGSNKSSQYFLLTKKLNCSVQIISWATAENMALSTMLCQSSDGWSGLDGANLTCYSESAINSTVMEVKNCTPISYLPPSMAVNTNTSSDITHIVVVAVVVVASFCAIVLLAMIIVSLAIKRCCTTTAELINYSDVVAESVAPPETSRMLKETSRMLKETSRMVIFNTPSVKMVKRDLQRNHTDVEEKDENSKSSQKPMQAIKIHGFNFYHIKCSNCHREFIGQDVKTYESVDCSHEPDTRQMTLGPHHMNQETQHMNQETQHMNQETQHMNQEMQSMSLEVQSMRQGYSINGGRPMCEVLCNSPSMTVCYQNKPVQYENGSIVITIEEPHSS